MADLTGLGLDGLPRTGDVYDENAAIGIVRPDTSQYSELGLAGVARVVQDFDAKAPASIAPRPYFDFTELSLNGLPGTVNTYSAKRSTVGIVGRVSPTVTMSATLRIARRYSTPTNITTSIRTVGSVITFAHKIRVTGGVNVSVTPRAGNLRYTRFGQNATINGNNSVVVTPFGNLKYRPRRFAPSAIALSVTAKSGLHYTPAPVKNATFTGRPRLSITPASAVTFHAGGTPHGITGSTGIAVTMTGRVQVTRQTTFAITGRTTVQFRPASSITHSTGAPRAYAIAGDITVTVRASATFIGLVVGANQQNHIDARPRVFVQAQSKITVFRAPTIAVLPGPGGKRRFIRIFR